MFKHLGRTDFFREALHAEQVWVRVMDGTANHFSFIKRGGNIANAEYASWAPENL